MTAKPIHLVTANMAQHLVGTIRTVAHKTSVFKIDQESVPKFDLAQQSSLNNRPSSAHATSDVSFGPIG